MKKVLSFSLFILISLALFSQETEKKAETKTGWNFGLLPAISFNTDLGFQYGGLINFFNYGDGTQYPDYIHNIYFEASRYTKGSAILRLAYDSKYLIPGVRITSDLAYLPDKAFDFYGFNGFETKFNKNWIDDSNTDGTYKTRMFYAMQNKMFRFKTDFQFPIVGEKLLVLAGFNLQNFKIRNVDIAKFNKGREEGDPKMLPDTLTLYDEYVDWNILSEKEKNGGFVPLLKAGIVFDTRDNEPNPMKGMWTELFIFGAPAFLGAESGFVKLNITHRQYFTIIKRDLSFAYRLSYQGKLAGEVPFYYQPEIETSLMKDQLGLGGSKTIRGIRRNRVIGDGVVYGNLELRWKPVHFNLINQKFYLGLNGFFDFGQTVQKVDVKSKLSDAVLNQYGADYFDFDGGEKMHMSYGAGLRIAMNQNFVIAVDYGRAIKEQDGDTGLYIGLNYLF